MDNQVAELPGVLPQDRLLIYPSWGDPGYCISAYQVNLTTIPFVLGITRQIASNNPRRWAIGFQQNITAAPTTLVGINTNPSTFGHQLTLILSNNWFTQFVFGPMIQMEWWGVSQGNCNVLMYEIELQ